MHISKFDSVNGVPDETQIQEWTETYFYGLLTIFNTFFAQLSVAEAVERMSQIPFAQLAAEELEGESEIIINMAVELVNDMAKTELDVMQAYLE